MQELRKLNTLQEVLEFINAILRSDMSLDCRSNRKPDRWTRRAEPRIKLLWLAKQKVRKLMATEFGVRLEGGLHHPV